MNKRSWLLLLLIFSLSLPAGYVFAGIRGSRRAVTSFTESGDTPQRGNITLSEGANITITRTGKDFEIAGAAGAAGDIESVGDCLTADCFTAASPDAVLTFDNATSGTVTLQTVAGALGTQTISLPAPTGTVILSSDALDALTDVTYTGPAAADLLIRNAGNTAWADIPMTGDILITSLGVTTIQAGAVTLTTDVTGVLPVANGGTNLSAATDDNVMVGNATTWESKTVPDCDTANDALNYDVTGNTFSCQSIAVGIGDVTDVGDCTGPACFTSGSPDANLTFDNATSGTVTFQTVAGALGAQTISLPAETGTVVTSVTALGGDVTGTVGATVVGDDSHAHTTTTISSLVLADDLDTFTSAALAGRLTNETGTGLAVFGTSPTIVTPTIASFTNATHDHEAAAGGGTLSILNATTGTLTVARGGTGATSLTNGGIVLGSGTAAVTVLAQATDGQLPIGDTGADPVLATLTAGTGIDITNAAGSITVASTVAGGAWEFVETLVLSGTSTASSTLPTDADIFMLVLQDVHGTSGTVRVGLRINALTASYDTTTIADVTFTDDTSRTHFLLCQTSDASSCMGTVTLQRTGHDFNNYPIQMNLTNGRRDLIHGMFGEQSSIGTTAVTTFTIVGRNSADAANAGTLSGDVHVFKLTEQ